MTQPGSVRAILVRHGLIGSQARDCHAPSSPSNPYVTFYVAGDIIKQGILIGPQSIMGSRAVMSVEEIAPQVIRIKQEARDAGQFITYEMRDDGERVRSFESTLSTGEAVIKNGKIVSSGSETPWLTKCK